MTNSRGVVHIGPGVLGVQSAGLPQQVAPNGRRNEHGVVLEIVSTMAALFFSATVVAQPATAAAGEVVQTKSGPVSVERLATLSEPWGMTFLPDGRLLVTEKPGRLRIYADGKVSEPIGGVPNVAYRDQGGLLDVEIDPDFARNRLVYLYFTEEAERQPKAESDTADPRLGPYQDLKDVMLKGGAVARGRLDGGEMRDVKVIWRQEPKTVGRNHFGGRLLFAPDGTLFITSGDRQRFEPAQNAAMSSLASAPNTVRPRATGRASTCFLAGGAWTARASCRKAGRAMQRRPQRPARGMMRTAG